MNIFDAHISGALSVSGSGEISNDLLISGNLTVLGWISGSVSGNITSADTASYAPKYTLTSSFEAFTSSYTTGSFTGSFAGNGAGLYNIPASGVTGLNLNRIADGSATASISQADGLIVNSNAEFTGSVKITGSIYLNGQPIGTGKLDETVFNSYTSSNNNRVSSLETSSGSLNTFTSSTNVRLNAIETSTSSLNSFTSSISTTIKNKLNSDSVLSGSIQVSLTGTTDFTAFSTSISQSISKSLSDSKDYTDLKLALYDPVFTNISALEIATASLNSFTSSINTTIKNKLNNDGVISGSIQVNLTGTTGYSTFSSSIATNDLNQNNRLDSLESASSSIRNDFNSYTGSNNTTNTTQNNRLTSIETSTSSLNLYTSSNTANINAIHTATSSLNSFSSSILGALEVTGSDLTIKGNLLVKGTTTQIDSTTLNIGDNIISLNGTATNNAGLVVQDASGASIVSGSLLWDTATDFWKAGKLGSEERIVLVNEYNTFSTSIDSRATSLQTATSSLNSYTSSNTTNINAIHTSTSSLNIFTSSANGRLDSLETSTGSLNTHTSSTNTRLGVIESTTGSLNTFTSSTDGRLNAVETSTSSLNTFSSSANDKLSSLESASSSIRTDFNSYTSSNNIVETTQNNKLSALETTTGSLNSYTSSNATNINAIHTATSSLNGYTSSTNAKLGLIETATGSLNSYTSSNITNINAIHTATSSLNSFTSSINTTIKNKLNADGVISGSIQVEITGTTGYSTFSGSIATTDSTQNDRIAALESMTGSYATTGSSNIVGNQTITGSVYITQNLTVLGTSSFLYLTASQLAVSSSTISVNVFEPMERFGGIKVYDSGSSAATASLLWDSQNNKWIYQNAVGGAYSGGMLMMGPRNTGPLGDEVGTIANVIMKGMGGDHISGSNITDDGSNVRVNSNTTITGSLFVTSTISSTNITAIESTTSSLNTFTSSTDGRLTSIETTTSSLNSYTSSTNTKLGLIETATSSLNSYTASNNSRLNTIESTTGSLNSYTSSTNSRLTSIESSTSSLNTFSSSTNSRLGLIETSTGSLNTFTSSTTSRLSSLETASGSIRSDFNSYTSSNNTTNNTQNSRLNSIESTTGSLNTYTSSNTTNINAIHTATSSLNSYTSSNNTTISSLNSYTSSNTTNINAIHTATSSLNTFTNSFNSAFSLSGADVTVKGNFIVSGTTTTVNSTTVAIGDNIIQLNGSGATNAGIVVRDATSPTTTSGSLLWDTTNDKWIAGPLGSEDDVVLRTATQTLTNKTINASQLIDATVTNAKLQNSAITIAGTSTSLGGSITAATILTGTGVVSGSYVSSIAGTTNQVSVSAATGAVTLSLPQDIHTGATPTFSGLTTNGRAQIGGTDSRGVLTVQTGSTQTFSANTDPTDSGRFFVMQNTSTTNAAGQYSNITLQINPGGTIGTGRVLGDIRLVRNALNGTSSRFIFGAFRDDATYKDYLTLDYTGASFAGSINGLTVSSGTITTGTWNGTAIANAYLANSSFYVGTTSISLGRASASQTLTGVSIDGTAANITTSSNTSITSLSNLATVGTITSGTWNGGVVAVSYGGTGLSSLTANRVPYGNGTSAFQSSANLTFDGSTLAVGGTLTATVKSFTIDHPTKEGLKLQYGVLEGPEHAVYVRGKLVGENKIVLPDYWYALIHEDTITVNLTPIGSQQVLFVESVNSNEIIVGGDANINCYYTVFAERKDVDKLITEHE